MDKIETRNPFDLMLNRFQKNTAEPNKADPAWEAFLLSARHGIREPIDITKDGQVIHGKRRFLAARALKLPEIPCIVRDESEAALILVESLVHRKHMTKGAAIYCALYLLPDYIQSAENRRLANLRRGAKIDEKPLKSPKLSTLNLGAEQETVEEICRRWGITRDVFFRAMKIKELFDKDPALKAQYEPQLLSGEKNLWNVLSAEGGADTDQSGRDMGVLKNAFSGFKKQTELWDRLSAEERQALRDRWVNDVAELPGSMRKALKEVL